MPKHKLDNAFVLGASCPDDRKRVDYWDTIITGFVLEARSTGGKTYYLRYQDQHDRQRQHKIGAVGDITFDRAKKEAQRLRSEVVLGGDPAVTKAHIKAIPTYADVAVDHLRDAKTHQKSYATTEMYMRRHILPRWGKLRMSEIHQADVAIWLAAKSAEGLAPATVEKIRGHLRPQLRTRVPLGRGWRERQPHSRHQAAAHQQRAQPLSQPGRGATAATGRGQFAQ